MTPQVLLNRNGLPQRSRWQNFCYYWQLFWFIWKLLHPIFPNAAVGIYKASVRPCWIFFAACTLSHNISCRIELLWITAIINVPRVGYNVANLSAHLVVLFSFAFRFPKMKLLSKKSTCVGLGVYGAAGGEFDSMFAERACGSLRVMCWRSGMKYMMYKGSIPENTVYLSEFNDELAANNLAS